MKYQETENIDAEKELLKRIFNPILDEICNNIENTLLKNTNNRVAMLQLLKDKFGVTSINDDESTVIYLNGKHLH